LSLKKGKDKIWSWVPKGSPIPGRTGRLTVDRNINSTQLNSISEAMTVRHTSTVAWDVTVTLNDACYLPICLFCMIFGTEHGTGTFLYNVDKLLPDFKVPRLRRWYY
jgi:hypothetical protein